MVRQYLQHHHFHKYVLGIFLVGMPVFACGLDDSTLSNSDIISESRAEQWHNMRGALQEKTPQEDLQYKFNTLYISLPKTSEHRREFLDTIRPYIFSKDENEFKKLFAFNEKSSKVPLDEAVKKIIAFEEKNENAGYDNNYEAFVESLVMCDTKLTESGLESSLCNEIGRLKGCIEKRKQEDEQRLALVTQTQENRDSDAQLVVPVMVPFNVGILNQASMIIQQGGAITGGDLLNIGLEQQQRNTTEADVIHLVPTPPTILPTVPTPTGSAATTATSGDTNGSAAPLSQVSGPSNITTITATALNVSPTVPNTITPNNYLRSLFLHISRPFEFLWSLFRKNHANAQVVAVNSPATSWRLGTFLRAVWGFIFI